MQKKKVHNLFPTSSIWIGYRKIYSPFRSVMQQWTTIRLISVCIGCHFDSNRNISIVEIGQTENGGGKRLPIIGPFKEQITTKLTLSVENNRQQNDCKYLFGSKVFPKFIWLCCFLYRIRCRILLTMPIFLAKLQWNAIWMEEKNTLNIFDAMSNAQKYKNELSPRNKFHARPIIFQSTEKKKPNHMDFSYKFFFPNEVISFNIEV